MVVIKSNLLILFKHENLIYKIQIIFNKKVFDHFSIFIQIQHVFYLKFTLKKIKRLLSRPTGST